MRLGVDSRRDALEALRAVEAWVSDHDACATRERGEVLRLLGETRVALTRLTRDRRTLR
jgi:hypothetical protein